MKWLLLSLAMHMSLDFFLPSMVRADENYVAVAQWIGDGTKHSLKYDLTKLLDVRQRELIQSGFTTFSRLMVHASDQDQLTTECTVKFDTWSEKYHVVRIGDSPRESTVTQFDQYGSICLSAMIDDSAILARFVQGGTIHATLTVEQISAEHAAKIRQWLVTQQTGLMKGLFSHMLGDLTVSNEVDITMTVPVRPPPKNTPGPSE